MASYLIPEPKTEIGSATYLGTLLITQNAGQYACKKRTDTEKWWAIGMIANNGTWWHPCIVSNVEKYSYSYSDRYIENDNPLSTKTGAFEYNGTTFYVSFGAYGSSHNELAPASATVPIYTETTLTDIVEAGKKLIELYKAAGGTIPGEEPEPSPSQEYSKVEYNRINWENKSTSLKTPINESNLNKMDKAISDLCENLDIDHTESDVKKLDKSSANKLLSETPTWDADTGILTFKFFDGTSFSVDFNIEKIPVSFSMDSAGVITMETADGTRWTADISKAIPSSYTFSNGARITFTETTGEDGAKKITADIVKGSITDEYLATDFLAKITSNVNAASSSAASAASSATDAAADAKLSQSYAIGGSGMRDGEDTDNAKYYAQKSAENLDYAKNFIEYGEDITD